MKEPSAAVPGATFLDEFRRKHRRAPRILHIGNIANNAFLNAKLLNAAGYDCDVLCYDYYHIMGCPEWEDAEFEGAVADQFRPDWSALNLNGYERPRWFAQGPQYLCTDYLLAKRRGNVKRARVLWDQLARFNKTRAAGHQESEGGFALGVRVAAPFREIIRRISSPFLRVWHTESAPSIVWQKLEVWGSRHGSFGWLLAAAAAPALMTLVVAIRFAARFGVSLQSSLSHQPLFSIQQWLDRFRQVFPERPDPLLSPDLEPYAFGVHRWRELLSCYDIVQAYATDVVYPMLAEKHPYLGFEHGTLRVFTLADNSTSRLTAFGYQQADHVFITNGDCLEYAEKIKVRSYTPMVHPIDDARIHAIAGDYAGRHAQYGVKYLFLCPLRHDWVVKGTDKYIRALPPLAERIGRDFRVIMTRWGAQVEDSERLAKSLGVDDLIVWIEPLNRGKLVQEHKSVDVVFDQIALPHFGATAPQAIAAGAPVVMSYDPASTEWIIPEPAPVLAAWTVDDIVEAVVTAIEPEWRARYTETARRWFDTYHSSRQAVRLLSEAYRVACLKTGLL